MDIEQILKEAAESGNVSKYSLKSVDSLEEDVRQALLKMIARGGKSSTALRTALIAKEFPREIVDQVITRFIEVSLIDDFALARDSLSLRLPEKLKPNPLLLENLLKKGYPEKL